MYIKATTTPLPHKQERYCLDTLCQRRKEANEKNEEKKTIDKKNSFFLFNISTSLCMWMFM